MISLKEAEKLSKDPKNEAFFFDETLSSNFLEFLEIFSEKISEKEESEKKLEIINLLIVVLKNNASNQAVRKRFFERKNLEIFSYFFHFFVFFDEKSQKTENLQNSKNSDKRFFLTIFFIFLRFY